MEVISSTLGKRDKMATKIYIQNNSVVLRKVGCFFFLVDIHEKNYGENFPLQEINETGLFIWEMLENGITYLKALDMLKGYFENSISEAIIKENLDSYLNYLLRLNYVKTIENE